MTAPEDRRGPPEIGFAARLHADRLRFAEAPDARVAFRDGPGVASSSESTRENLPDRVEPGAEYEQVRVDYRLVTRTRRPGRPSRRRRNP